MMESNDYGHYDDSFNEYVGGHDEGHYAVNQGNDQITSGSTGILMLGGGNNGSSGPLTDGLITGSGDDDINNKDNDDPRILSLPRILLMGPRRGGKTSIQVSAFFVWFD
jgi:hypothetical protein